MEFLKRYKYTLVVLIVLTIGGLMLNANYYINKRPVSADKRVLVEEQDISFLDHTRVLEVGKHTEEDVLLGFDPDYDWGIETSYNFENKKTITFETIPNFDYGSVTIEVGAEEGTGVTSEFTTDASNEGELFRPVYYGDVVVTQYYVDVYGVFGAYKYSFNKYTNAVVNDSLSLNIINQEDAEKAGLQ